MSDDCGEEEQFNDDDDDVAIIGDDDGSDDIISDDGDDYYHPPGAQIEEPSKEALAQAKRKEEIQALTNHFQPKNATAHRLISDLQIIRSSNEKELGFRANPIKNDLFNWEIQLFGFEKGSPMYNDLQKYKKTTGRDYVQLQVSFPPDYPNSPPFVRVVQPRFQFHTGRVTVGGSLCTDILTMESWNPTYDIESLMINVTTEIIAGSPRIDFRYNQPYSLQEAKQAYLRVASDHRWKPTSWLPNK